MDKIIYSGMNAASQMMQAMQSRAHALANVGTIGFKSDFVQLVSDPVKGKGLFASRTFVEQSQPKVDIAAGTLIHTDRNLDAALSDGAWFSVETPEGQMAYTRAGNFDLGPSGELLTANGLPVLGTNGPIQIPPADEITLAQDGKISIIPKGSTDRNFSVVGQIKIVTLDENTITKNNFGLISGEETTAATPPKMSVGVLESSNVNPTEAMTDMIQLSREYEMSVKVMKLSEEDDKKSVDMMDI